MEENYFSEINDEDFKNRLKTLSELEMSPNIVIISPYRDGINEYTLDQLMDKFNKYNLLIPKNKRLSNQYSFDLWLYNVPNMYQLMKVRFDKLSNYIDAPNLVSESIEIDDNRSDDTIEDYEDKLNKSSQFDNNPNIVIINPFNGDNRDYDMPDLINKFNKYNLLTPKNKRLSNSYSMSIWGMNVPNMYQKMKGILVDSNKTEEITDNDNKFETVISNVNESYLSGDIIGLISNKVYYTDESVYDKARYSKLNESIDKMIYERDFMDCISNVVPYFTVDEFNEMRLELEDIDPKYYYKTLQERMYLYENSHTEELEQSILSLGWNPSVELTEKNIMFARERQNKWLKEHACRIVDLTNIKFNNIINESSTKMEKIYKKFNMYPIYIVLSFTYTIPGKVISIYTHSKFSHAGLSLNSDLKDIMTYNKNKEKGINGFGIESLEFYLNVSKNSYIGIFSIFVDKFTRDKIKAVLDSFIENKDKTKYGFKNLLDFVIKKSKDYDPNNLSLVCSQFVDVVLKLANIDINPKSSNLTSPKDLSILATTNPKVFKLYEGRADNYKDSNTENTIMNLIKSFSIEDIRYGTKELPMVESKLIEELLRPTLAIQERKFPISINDKGDLEIKLYKSLEQEYQEAHRLLKQYGTENIEGIKHELARLFYVNCALEKKIKKMERSDENYKKFVDLRARVLNDFKKYFKIVLDKEPDFDFSEYFKQSEYYNGNIIIDNSVLQFTGKLIEKFLKSLGL